MEDRIAIPLVMLPGNMEILMERSIEVKSVSFMPYVAPLDAEDELPDGLDPSQDAVVMMFHFGPGQRDLAFEAGMKFNTKEEIHP